MYDLADFALSMAPPDRQVMQAQLLRKRGNANALQEAQTKAYSNKEMMIAAALSNNPELAAAAKMAHETQVKQHAPVSMGQMGFALPGSGDFVESPMYTEEKDAARAATRDNQRARLEASIEARREQEAARAERERERMIDRGENEGANRVLRESLAKQADETRRMTASAANDTRLLVASMAAGARNSGKADKDEAKASADRDKALQRYSGVLEKAGVPEFHNALETAEATIGRYKEGKLPAYGRAWSMVPTFALDNEGQSIRTDLAAAANSLLKSRSGLAVTKPEEQRFLMEVASGAGMDETTLRRGWANLRKNFDARRKSIAAGFAPDVHEEFVTRGGVDHRAPGDKYLAK